MEHNMQCGTCERTWNSFETPTPSARCPFEYEHDTDTITEPFDQGTDERIPVCQLKIELFLTETKDLRIMTASEVRDLLLDLLIEMGK